MARWRDEGALVTNASVSTGDCMELICMCGRRGENELYVMPTVRLCSQLYSSHMRLPNVLGTERNLYENMQMGMMKCPISPVSNDGLTS